MYDKKEKNRKLIIAILIILIIIFLICFFYFKSINVYTVSFDVGNGKLILNKNVMRNTKIEKPDNPTKEGYEFVEWQLNGKTYDFNSPIKDDTTLVAVWKAVSNDEKYYTVTFNTNGGNIIDVQNILEGDKTTIPENPTKDATETINYTFKEWQLNGKTYDFNTPVTEDITLTAVWKEENIKKTYTITFDSVGGTLIDSQKIKDGKKINVPENPTKKGYTFVEWQLNGKTYNFNTAVRSDITLVAKWNKNSGKTYTVTFDSNGGSTIKSQTIEEGNKVTKPSNPTRSGYTFVEWQLNETTYNFNTIVTSDITLTAKWKEIVVQTYTVTFDSNGGSNVNSQTVTSGKKATKPSNPTRDGYTFVEWQLNGKTYNFNTAVTKNITLIAKWKQKTYTIKAVAKDDYSPYLELRVYENGTQITVYAIYYTDGVKLNGFSENKNTLESVYLIQKTNGGEKFRASVVG